MSTIKVKAIFKGQDNSRGYRTNSEYILTICHENHNIQIEHHYNQLYPNNANGYCEYESIVAFLNNWDDIRKV